MQNTEQNTDQNTDQNNPEQNTDDQNKAQNNPEQNTDQKNAAQNTDDQNKEQKNTVRKRRTPLPPNLNTMSDRALMQLILDHTLENKDEIAEIKDDMKNLEKNLKGDMKNLEKNLKGDMKNLEKNLAKKMDHLCERLGDVYENSLCAILSDRLHSRGLKASFPVNRVIRNEGDWAELFTKLNQSQEYQDLKALIPSDKQSKLSLTPSSVEFNLFSYTESKSGAEEAQISPKLSSAVCLAEATTSRFGPHNKAHMQQVFKCSSATKLQACLKSSNLGPLLNLLYKLLQLERQADLVVQKHPLELALLVSPNYDSVEDLTALVFQTAFFQKALQRLYALHQQGKFALTSLKAWEFLPSHEDGQSD